MLIQNQLDEVSIPVGCNIPIKFKKCTRKQGGYKDKRWCSLDFLFLYTNPMTQEEKWFVHKAFQPAPERYFDKRDYAIFLSETLNSLAGQDLWSNIKGCRGSWEEFYTEYLQLTDKFRNRSVYIKTTACPYFRNKENWIACFANKNFISVEPDLAYTYLEFNEVEEFLDDDYIEALKKQFNITSEYENKLKRVDVRTDTIINSNDKTSIQGAQSEKGKSFKKGKIVF